MSTEPTSPEITLAHLAALDALAPVIGRITMKWGDIQCLVLIVLKHLMKGDLMRARDIFFALKSDRTQRDVTMALAERFLTHEPELLADLRSVMNKINTL